MKKILFLFLCTSVLGTSAFPQRTRRNDLSPHCNSGCSDPQNCSFGNVANVALGGALLQVNSACHLVVGNIGSSGLDGVAQVSLPPGTADVITRFTGPLFGPSSSSGDKETVTCHASVPGGVFYQVEVENIGGGVIEARPDFSFVGATLYTVTVLNHSSVVGVFPNLTSALFQTSECEEVEVNWKADGTASYEMKYSGPVTVPAATVVAFGDSILVSAQNAHAHPSITQVDYRFRNIPTVEMTSQFVGPVQIPAIPLGGMVALVVLAIVGGAILLRSRPPVR